MTTDLAPGTRLGNYTITGAHPLGFLAVHQVLPRRALLRLGASHTEAIRVLREACLLEALHHPGIPRVYESGLLPDRRPWFACEVVDAPALGATPSGAVDRLAAIALLRDVAEVLEHAHRRGAIHCGLRPSRIALTGRARGFPLCLTDWSDARAHDAAPQPYQPSVASWHYTSPELATGAPIDDRVDIYALGVIAYQLLTGVLPFAGRVATTTAGEQQHTPTEVHCPDAPRELTQLVDQMLAYDQWDRPSSAEVHADLTWLVESMATASPRAATGIVRIRRPRWTPPLAFHSGPIALPGGPAHDRAKTDLDPE